ncbi:hypothetical protein K8F61_05160 [Microbacterium resistens]|uniref:Tail assembly chaperone n=1 Tax=Microbacterium resistens TaxID=156977 RepID=A0ABY3RU55_9MICO|nr:hypothetical protein [Microbacterium resistens]UGS27579.1 hypothetical protein K8F61_05160 [Microbacterium resistens]
MVATTTKKPTARKTPARKPSAPKTAETSPLTYTVVEDVLHYTTKAGFKLTIDLDFPPDLLKLAMGADEEDRSEEEQFEIMARTFGANFQEAYAAMGVIERRRVQRAMFLEFQKAMDMPLGESLGSSDS